MLTFTRYNRSRSSNWTRVGAFAALALAAGAIATGCSGSSSATNSPTNSPSGTSSPPSSPGTGTAQACEEANTQFDTWLTADNEAQVADDKAKEDWLNYDQSTGSSMPSPSSPQLIAAINLFSTENKHAHALRQIADKDLAIYQADYKNCDQSSLPTGCRQDFAQHPLMITAATQAIRADDTLDQFIAVEQQAYRAGNPAAVDAQVNSYNAAVDSYNAAAKAFNDASDAHFAAAERCSLTPSPATSV